MCCRSKTSSNPKTSSGDWAPFFSNDVAAQLAITAVQNVPFYRQKVRESLNFLNTRQNATETEKLRTHLDSLFSGIATLTLGFDQLIKKLPEEVALKESLQNLVRGQLAPALKQLIAYYKGGADVAQNRGRCCRAGLRWLAR